MNPVPSLTELVDRVRNGDAAAVGLIDTHYKPVVEHIVRQFLNADNSLRSVYETNDFAQTLYRRLLDLAADFDPETHPPADPIASGAAFVSRIVNNRVCDHGRRRRVTPDADVAAAAPDPVPGPQALAELRDLVQRVMDQLTPAHREIAVRRAAGESWKEISPADHLRVSQEFLRASRALTNPAAGADR